MNFYWRRRGWLFFGKFKDMNVLKNIFFLMGHRLAVFVKIIFFKKNSYMLIFIYYHFFLITFDCPTSEMSNIGLLRFAALIYFYLQTFMFTCFLYRINKAYLKWKKEKYLFNTLFKLKEMQRSIVNMLIYWYIFFWKRLQTTSRKMLG